MGRRFALLAVVAAALGAGAPAAVADYDTTVATTAVTPAHCGPGSMPEDGIQGEVPKADRDSGRSLKGYRCNLELVGQYREGEGASWQVAWYGSCAYYGTLPGSARKTAQGVQVVDASDPAHPVRTAVLDTPAMNSPHESLKVAPSRGLLAATAQAQTAFDIYDVSADCAHPRHLATLDIAGTQGHEGEFSPDGLTYWDSERASNDYCPIDVRDPTHPRVITCWPEPGTTHGLSLSDDGTKAYMSEAQKAGAPPSANGLIVADVSDVQHRVANPQVKILSQLFWADGAQAQMTRPMTIGGNPYLVMTDELGHGAARIIDISDVTHPKIVTRLKLAVNLPQATGLDVADGGEGLCASLAGSLPAGGCPGFVYDGHYCSVDDTHDTTAVACGYFESGIRVFDVRDPANPKEIAYFNPGPIPSAPLPGASIDGKTAEHCAAQVRFVPQTHELWTTCMDNEFMVLRFTNGAWPFTTSAAPAPAAATAAATATPNTGGVRPSPAMGLVAFAVGLAFLAARRMGAVSRWGS